MNERQQRKKIKKNKLDSSKRESNTDLEYDDELNSNSRNPAESGKVDTNNRLSPNASGDTHSSVLNSPIPSLDGVLLNQFIDTQLKALNLMFGSKQCSVTDQAVKVVFDQLRIGSKLADLYTSMNEAAETAQNDKIQDDKGKALVIPEFESDNEITINDDSICLRMNYNNCNNYTEQVSYMSPLRQTAERISPTETIELPFLSRRNFNQIQAEINFRSNDEHLRSPDRQVFTWPNLLIREEENDAFLGDQKEHFSDLFVETCSRKGSLQKYLESDQ